MYTLRIIEESRENENYPFEQVIENHSLGNSYAHLKNGATKEFDDILIKEYPDIDKKTIDGIIKSERGVTFFIMKNNINRTFSYFIMTENGKTFERL